MLYLKLLKNLGHIKLQRFTGNHIRALLDSAVPEEDGTSKLHKTLMENDALKCFVNTNHAKFEEKFKLGMDALYELALIQDMFKSDILTATEIDQLRDNVYSLENIMKQLPEVRVGHKFHLILKHVPSVAARDKIIGFFSEHGIESMHALVNQLMRRLTVRSNETRLERVIQYVNCVAVTRDQYVSLEMLEDGEEHYDDEQLLFPEDFANEDQEVNEEETIVIDLAELKEQMEEAE
uniref:Uncharacterized protein n=1 Tax=Panagrolaimus sp. ES5 TaxID=591445 RepID=A0AC34GPY5_9BILA